MRRLRLEHLLALALMSFLPIMIAISVPGAFADKVQPEARERADCEARGTDPPVADRSPMWPTVRAEHLRRHPRCEACGQTDDLNVHHVVPFDHDPTKELDPTNLITLCTDGVGHCHCHLLIGHGGNFRCRNDNVVRDAKRFRRMLERKVCDPILKSQISNPKSQK
jgi:hypothetical protein